MADLKQTGKAVTTALASRSILRPAFRQATIRNLIPPRAVWDARLPRRFRVRAGSTSFQYIGDNDDIVARHLYWGALNRWERETWPTFLSLAREARGFLDVGSFTGAYTLAACAVN